jgi:hypothetical protein
MPRGSCLCGELAYALEAPFLEAHHCHCGFCRKDHGTPYATYGAAPESGLRWLRGREGASRYESSPGFERWFCPRCGSTVPGTAFAGMLFVPLGNLDGDPGVRPGMHIFTASKAPWWEIRDDLPQHAAFPPGFDAPVFPTRDPRDPPGRPRGSCLCGRVAYVLVGEPRRAWSCHCGRCRKARAAGHATDLALAADGLRFTRGEDALVSYRLPGARSFETTFCRTCGAKLPRADRERGLALVPMGALDDDPGIRPSRHAFVSEKAPWIEIRDDLPQDPAEPPVA